MPIPNNKSNIYYCPEDEAHYLAGFINSGPAQEALGRFAVSTGVTPGALARLPVPRFETENEQHQDLARLGRAAASFVGDPARLGEIERQLDDAVWRLAATLD